jgi:hypothetical protein
VKKLALGTLIYTRQDRKLLNDFTMIPQDARNQLFVVARPGMFCQQSEDSGRFPHSDVGGLLVYANESVLQPCQGWGRSRAQPRPEKCREPRANIPVRCFSARHRTESL